jgi:hypothetical protein
VVGALPETNPTILTYTYATPVAGQVYKFKVSALNILGESLTSDSIFVYAASMPEAPVNPPSVVEFDQTSITVALTPIATGSLSGGTPVTGYIVMIDDGLGGPFTQV